MKKLVSENKEKSTGVVRRTFKMKNENGTSTWFARGLAMTIAMFGLGAMIKTSILDNVERLVFANQNVIAYTATTSTAKDTTNTAIKTSTGLVVATPTLADYLSGLCCSGCHQRCPLTNLRCGRGEAYKEEATVEYNQKYTRVSTTTVTSNNTTSNVTSLNWSNYTLNVTPNPISVKVGGTVTLSVTAKPKAASGTASIVANSLVTYKTSNASIAKLTINSQGKAVISGLKKGTTKILVTAKGASTSYKFINVTVK